MDTAKQKQSKWNGDDSTNTPEQRPGGSPIPSKIIAHFAAQPQHIAMISENGKRKARLQEPTAKTGEYHPHNNTSILHLQNHTRRPTVFGTEAQSKTTTTTQQTVDSFLWHFFKVIFIPVRLGFQQRSRTKGRFFCFFFQACICKAKILSTSILSVLLFNNDFSCQ